MLLSLFNQQMGTSLPWSVAKEGLSRQSALPRGSRAAAV